MARITVEDCLEKVENRFELVLLASKRAKQLSLGREPLLASKNKCTVTALREIAAGLVTKDNIDRLNSPGDELIFDSSPKNETGVREQETLEKNVTVDVEQLAE